MPSQHIVTRSATEHREAVRLAVDVSEHNYSTGYHLTRLRETYEVYPNHDAACDAQVAEIGRLAACLNTSTDPEARRLGAEILTRCARYVEHDRHEDATVAEMDVRASQAQIEVRVIGATCDEIETGHRQGRLRRGMLRANQPSLLEATDE